MEITLKDIKKKKKREGKKKSVHVAHGIKEYNSAKLAHPTFFRPHFLIFHGFGVFFSITLAGFFNSL
jgi:hypothetical protein